MGVAESVPQLAGPAWSAGSPREGECLFTVGDGLLVVAEQHVQLTEGVERVALAEPVTGRAAQRHGLFAVAYRVAVATLLLAQQGEVVVGLCGRSGRAVSVRE